MKYTTTVFVQAEDKPYCRMGGANKDIPVLALDIGERFTVYFGDKHTLKQADAYLTALVHAAQELQEQVRILMQDAAKVPAP